MVGSTCVPGCGPVWRYMPGKESMVRHRCENPCCVAAVVLRARVGVCVCVCLCSFCWSAPHVEEKMHMEVLAFFSWAYWVHTNLQLAAQWCSSIVSAWCSSIVSLVLRIANRNKLCFVIWAFWIWSLQIRLNCQRWAVNIELWSVSSLVLTINDEQQIGKREFLVWNMWIHCKLWIAYNFHTVKASWTHLEGFGRHRGPMLEPSWSSFESFGSLLGAFGSGMVKFWRRQDDFQRFWHDFGTVLGSQNRSKKRSGG